jgi:hypothetical protein
MKQHVRAFCTLALLAGSFPSVGTRKSAFPSRRSHGSSSRYPGPSYSADVSDIGG